MKRWTVVLLLLCSACAPKSTPAPRTIPVPALCFEVPQCGDAICAIGTSALFSTPEAALADALGNAVLALAVTAAPDLGFPPVCFDCGETANIPQVLKITLSSLLKPQTRYTERVVYDSMTPTGTAYKACVQAEVSREAMAQAIGSIDPQELQQAIPKRKDPQFY